jgi:hypothetical protein
VAVEFPPKLSVAMLSTADECRTKAMECIERATSVRDPQVKHILQDLAQSWWQLAEHTDQMKRDAPSLRSLTGKQGPAAALI